MLIDTLLDENDNQTAKKLQNSLFFRNL